VSLNALNVMISEFNPTLNALFFSTTD